MTNSFSERTIQYDQLLNDFKVLLKANGLKDADFDKYHTAADQLKHYIQVTREDYASGKSGWKRVPFERVTVIQGGKEK